MTDKRLSEKERRERTRERFAEDPGLVNPANLAPDELVRHEAVMAAHRSALDGDFKPGIALGIFPESAEKPSKSP